MIRNNSFHVSQTHTHIYLVFIVDINLKEIFSQLNVFFLPIMCVFPLKHHYVSYLKRDLTFLLSLQSFLQNHINVQNFMNASLNMSGPQENLFLTPET